MDNQKQKAKKYIRESEYRCHEIKVTSKIWELS